MNPDRIEEGDTVTVNNNTVGMTLAVGTVLHVRCSDGDSWIIRDDKRGLIYISEPCTIYRAAPKP